MHNEDTIFALSSGQGKAGVAVIRISGTKLHPSSFIPNPSSVKPRQAYLVDFYDIDKLILIYFPAPNSFTGEDVIELHCHGGVAVMEAIFTKLRSFGFRYAEKGEFSKRAFQNGKMDLIEVDSMRALIDAKTESQRRRAIRGITGLDSEVYMLWRNDMITLSALAAARMDYDSDDLPVNINEQIQGRARGLLNEIKHAVTSNARIIESGFNVVLAGETNVGKSSLFNRILGEGRAIVSDIAGTTRDVISAELDIDGFLVRLIDTAGIRESTDAIEKMGIEKTKEQVENADLVLYVRDSVPACAGDTLNDNGIVVINKCDLINSQFTVAPATASADLSDGVLTKSEASGEGWKAGDNSQLIYVSAKTGEGIDDLMKIIKENIKETAGNAESDLAVSSRAKAHLETAVLELEKGIGCVPELESEHIMAAADEIGRILGIIGSDEIYDSVFGQLCLGK